MFGSKTKKLLEESSKQMTRLNETLERFLEMKANESNALFFDGKEKSINDPLQAAYALNLCSVSISQIVDYDDLNILEQEYDAILNNLNLQNFPKDEALLKILKQILDTVTFFRIQEGDKQFIEREYKQKMKNAIWSAVSNVGLVVASGNPYVMLMSLATQVGTGYMNYRKQKADNTLEYDKAKWQLQRAAIEQFNGLRRELFDTAWRLAEKYNFPDEYRLTERQIHQYNDILMDSDIYRRYERLVSVESNFNAYPPYWYYRGRTAALIALDAGEKNEMYDCYKKSAIESFRKYLEINHCELLRVDTIASSCCLELAGLLSPTNDRDEILMLLDKAANNAGTHNDIKQLCANGYLSMGEIELAKKYLRGLVVEQYNTIPNAQILSSLYCKQAIYEGPSEVQVEYQTLTRLVNPKYLMSIPTVDEISKTKKDNLIESLNDYFLKCQRLILNTKYRLVLDALDNKFAVILNRQYQHCGGSKKDDYFINSHECKQQRKADIENYFISKKHVNEFNRRISTNCYEYDLISYLNEYANAISCIHSFCHNYDLIDGEIKKHINIIRDIDIAIQNDSFELKTIELLQKTSYENFTLSFRKDFLNKSCTYVTKLSTIAAFSAAEDELNRICEIENLPTTYELYSNSSKKSSLPVQRPIVLSSTTGYLSSESEKEMIQHAKQKCDEYKDKINNDRVTMVCDNDQIDIYRQQFKERIKQFDDLNIAFKQKRIVGILKTNNKGFSNDTLYFSSGFLYKIEGSFFKKDELISCDYPDIVVDNNTGNLMFDGHTIAKYDVTNTNILFELAQKINAFN